MIITIARHPIAILLQGRKTAQVNYFHIFNFKSCISKFLGTTQAQANPMTRVLKWQDYLQQVRAGIRSAPNSPTTSPTVKRGSALLHNNFMVHGKEKGVKKFKATAKKQPRVVTQVEVPVSKTNPNPSKSVLTAQDLIDMAKNKGNKANAKLQEFDQYMAKLQKNLKPVSTNQTILILPKQTTVSAATSNVTSTTCLPIKIPLNSTAVNTCTNNMSIKLISSTGKSTMQNKDVSKMVMVNLPTVSVINRNTQAKSSTSQNLNTAPAAINIDQNSNKIEDPRLLVKSNVVPTSDLKLPQMAKKVKNAETNKLKTTDNTPKPVPPPKSSAPTFKLVTPNKDTSGSGSKSLILSGVTGQLRDILLTLAKQQNSENQKLNKNNAQSSEDQQQKILQQLLSAISKLNSKSTSSSTVKNSNTKIQVSKSDLKSQTKPTIKILNKPEIHKDSSSNSNQSAPLPAKRSADKLNVVSKTTPTLSLNTPVYPKPAIISTSVVKPASKNIITCKNFVIPQEVKNGASGSLIKPCDDTTRKVSETEISVGSPSSNTVELSPKEDAPIGIVEVKAPTEANQNIVEEFPLKDDFSHKGFEEKIPEVTYAGELQSDLVSSTSAEDTTTVPVENTKNLISTNIDDKVVFK